MVLPDENWEQFSVKLLKKFRTLLEAQQALAKAEETSNLSSDDEEELKKNRASRKRKLFSEDEEIFSESQPKQKSFIRQKPVAPRPFPSPVSLNNCTSYSGSSSSPICLNQPIVLVPQETPSILSRPSCSTSDITSYHQSHTKHQTATPVSHYNQSLTSGATSSPTHTSVNHNQQHGKRSNDRIILHQIQMQMTDLYEKQEKMEKKIDLILNKLFAGSSENVLVPGAFGNLPVSDMDKFLELDDTLKDEHQLKQLVRLFVSLGGKDMKSAVNIIMRRIMIDEVAMNFSYSGKSTADMPKLQFSKFSVCKCVQVAVRKTYTEATEASLKGFISLWLQQAKYRTSKRKKDMAPAPDAVPDADPL